MLDHVFTIIVKTGGQDRVLLGWVGKMGKIRDEEHNRQWPQKWRDYMLQQELFNPYEGDEGRQRDVLPKLPYKYFYRFLSAGDKQPRKLMVEDWELGALYWRCLHKCGGDEQEANWKVKQKYFDEFVSKCDPYFFLGTTLEYHRRRALNPFIIIGLFYPLKPKEVTEKNRKPKPIDPSGVHQPPLFEM